MFKVLSVSQNRNRHNMPPGLKSQIVFAIVITLGALLVLPTALSAKQSAASPQPATIALPSVGTVKTTLLNFSAADFAATAFADWD